MHKTTVGRDDAKQFPPGTFVTDDVMRALPDTDVFGVKWKPNQPKKELGNAKFRNCAIVSSSSTLKKKRLGKQIDENDVILRLNNAPTKGHEVDVGSRTTVRFTNEAYQGMREHVTEALVGKWHIQNPRADRLPKMMAKKIHPINPRFMRYAEKNIEAVYKEQPTSGFVCAVMLMHVCERVTAYGFTAGKTLKAWYFDKRPKNKNGPHKGKKFWLRNKSWQIDQWRFADMSPAVDVRKGGGGGGGARKEAAEERRRSLSPSERSSQRGEQQDDEYGGSDLSPITRRSRTLLHNMKGERRCITDLANHGLLTLL